MSAATMFTRLYPPAVRERWGAEIGREVASSGIRSWPDTLVGAGRLWLHPSDWPESAPGQTRRVLAVAMFTVVAATALLLRAAGPSTLTADPSRPLTSLWLGLILVGAGLGAPVPLLRWAAWRRLAGDAVGVLAAPAVAVLAMILIANSGLVEHPTGAVRAALFGWYWVTLGFTAVRLCTFVACLARTARMPGRARLRGALLVIGAGLVLAAGQTALTVTWSAPDAGLVGPALVLGLLGAATIGAGQDLRGRRR
ncbi:hypothetical protein ACFO1B_12645 [Dactylosporangium siamense]|uniref:Uncharacterized protein n=1 Tax=Dactylosporangium siamense TaxID=685454 RepID=A0A919PRZ2_9ACTN|nr:hypothetical protein [Dactylosporangium siamense]GIG49132.1 hypothetical protein Dsi01nite_071730 [Dactylosporangium siamense]